MLKRQATSPLVKTSKKSEMATVAVIPTRSKHETDPDKVVNIELVSINGNPFFGQISDQELLYIWTEVFLRKKEELFGVASTKSLTRLVRGKFKLNVPTKFSDIIKAEHFSYEKTLKDGKVEKIEGAVLGFNKVKPIELGKRAHIHVKTNFGVELEGVANWLRIYGSVYQIDHIVNDNTGLCTDTVEAEVVLRDHIPEFLPMYGQKAQVIYPGVLKICVNCYTFGHYRKECGNRRRNWIEFAIQYIKEKNINIDGLWKAAFKRWEQANADTVEERMDT